jgi:hypothetical protein
VDVRMVPQQLRDSAAEQLAVYGKRATRRHAGFVCYTHNQRARAAHFLFDEAYGIGEVSSAQTVGTYELSEEIVMLRGRTPCWLLLHQAHAHARVCELKGALAARKARADDRNFLHSASVFAGASGIELAALAAELFGRLLTGEATPL